MVFDPSKSDPERMCDTVENKFPDSWVQLFDQHGQTAIKVEPQSGSNSKQKAKEIESFLSEKGLRTRISDLSGDGTIYEVTGTTDSWK